MILQHRTALVVGGGAGLGRAIATAFAREGAALAVADLTTTTARETLALAGHADTGLALAMNVAQPAEIRAGIQAVVAHFGQLDIMVNCAAICLVDPLANVTPERWDQVFDINARGAFFCLTAAAEVMLPRKYGRLITISTPATRLAVPNFASYGASKAAVDSFTKSCAAAWAPHGLTVNMIVPGRMTGGMVDALDRDLAKLTGKPEFRSILRPNAGAPIAAVADLHGKVRHPGALDRQPVLEVLIVDPHVEDQRPGRLEVPDDLEDDLGRFAGRRSAELLHPGSP